MRRLLALLLAGALAVPPALAAEETGFSDVSPDDWFAPYVEICVEEGLMQGTGGGRFSPEQYVTSAECVLLAIRLDRLRKGLEGPLPAAPADWSSVVITDETGTVLFSTEDYQGYSIGGGLYTICLPPEKVAPLEGKPGRLTLHGTEVFEGQFTVETDTDEPRGGLSFRQGEQLSGREFDAITGGYDLAEELAATPDWALDGLYYAKETGMALDLGYLGCGLYPADRLGFLTALEGVTDPREMEQINTVETLPDVPADSYTTWTDSGRSGTSGNFGDFYRSGVLSGTDQYGTFNGSLPLTRAEAAAMLGRILRPELRLSFTLTPYPWEAEYELIDLELSAKDWWNEGEVKWIFPDSAEHLLDQQVLRVSPRYGGEIDYHQSGIFTMDGKWLVEPGRYGQIRDFGPDGLAVVGSSFYWYNSQYGVIDAQGREVLAPVYDSVCLGGDGIIAAYSEKEDAYSLFDAQGNPLGQFSAPGLQICGVREDLALYQEEESQLWGYLDLEGKVVIPARFEMAGLFYDGLAAVVMGGKTGYIGHSGTPTIPCQFEAIDYYEDRHFQDGAAIVTDSEGYELVIDRTGKQLSPHRYNLLNDSFSPNGLAFYQYWDETGEDFGQGFLDTRGVEHPMPEYYNSYQIMARSGGYYLVSWPAGGVYNYMDDTGKILFPIWFSEATPLTQEGKAIVLRDGQYYRLELK